MTKYKFTIEVVRDNEHIICIYVRECKSMFDALQKASIYAGFQMYDENADYIQRVEVERYEEDA